jgi:hypothetical protein
VQGFLQGLKPIRAVHKSWWVLCYTHTHIIFLLIYSDLLWFKLSFPDFSWFFLIFPDFSWFFLIFPDFSWFFLIFPDFSWFILIYADLCWFIQDEVTKVSQRQGHKKMSHMSHNEEVTKTKSQICHIQSPIWVWWPEIPRTPIRQSRTKCPWHLVPFTYQPFLLES